MNTQILSESVGIIVAGILLCLAGWQLFRASVYIIGFVLGASIGYILAVFALKIIENSIAHSWESWIIIMVSILFGFLGIFLIKTIIKITLFVAGLLFGILVVSIYSGSVEGIAHPYRIEMIFNNISIWSILSGLVFGILFIFFEKWFVILYTSAIGSYLLMIHFNVDTVFFYGIFVIGTIVQLWMSKGKKVKNLKIINTKTGN